MNQVAARDFLDCDVTFTSSQAAAGIVPFCSRPIHLSYDQVPDREERETATSAGRASKNAGISLSHSVPSRCWQIGRVKTRAAAALRPPNKPENKCGQKRTAAEARGSERETAAYGVNRRLAIREEAFCFPLLLAPSRSLRLYLILNDPFRLIS